MKVIALLVLVTAFGCKKQEKEKDLVEQSKDGLQYLAEKAEQEKDAYTAQREKLDKAVAETQTLIEDGHLDQAEAKLADIHWMPDEGMLNDGEKKLIQIYDEKRSDLRNVIARKRR
jgi:hypothetical protein